MAGRLTWRVPQWRPFAWVEPAPELHARWGAGIATLVEVFRSIAAGQGNSPGPADVRRTLAAIVREPGAVPLRDLDAETSARLDEQAWKLHRQLFATLLPLDELARCAAAALASMAVRRGRRPSQPLAVQFLVELLPLLPRHCQRGPARAAAVGELLLAAGLVSPHRLASPDADLGDTVRLLLMHTSRAMRRGAGRVS
jgi:hypothetical protein